MGEQELKNVARPVRVYRLKLDPANLPSPNSRRLAIFSALAAGGKTRDETSPSPGPAESAPRLSLVVLPFVNVGGNTEHDHFVDGVTETLTTDLSRIADLFVISRNTVGGYKGRSIDIRQIGLELGVRYVLEGSVQSADNRIRISVQLIDAESGAHLWAERFDKPYADLLDTQEKVAARLARAIHVEVIAAESRRAARADRSDSLGHTPTAGPH
jgi:TolB-like protein